VNYPTSVRLPVVSLAALDEGRLGRFAFVCKLLKINKAVHQQTRAPLLCSASDVCLEAVMRRSAARLPDPVR
jgi:hypothetical protein